ncbi:MAG: metal ABC transporter substrate-binding protein [Hyphomicrobiales bacterium]
MILLLPVLLLAAAVLACGESKAEEVGQGASGTHDDFSKDDGKLKVATTVAPLTSIVLQIGGDRVHIHGLIPDGVDSHTYEPKPSDAKVLSRADLLIMNGASLEGTTEKVAKENLKDPSKIYKLADNTLQGEDPETGFLYDFSFPRAEGKPNPHLWMNPLYALKYAELTKTWLSENDPDNADYYQQNFDRFKAVIEQLDAAIRKDQETVPPENRKLLTYHDSWAYWAREYGWEVIGAIQPSDFSEPSAQDVANLIQQIRELKLPAIFGSEVFPSSVLETISKETGAVFEDELSDDAPPGKEDDANHTYVGMVVQDMQIMFERLGGSAPTVAQVPVVNQFVRGGD